MFETLYNAIITWNQRATDRQKLQHFYGFLVLVTVFVAGIIALATGTVSDLLLYISGVIATTFVVNFVGWSLLKTTILESLPRTNQRTTTKPVRKTTRR